MTDERGVLVLGEVFVGMLSPHTHEMFTAGRDLASELGVPFTFAYLGSELEEAQSQVGELDPTIRIVTQELEEVEPFIYEAWLDAAEKVVREVNPRVIVVPGTTIGADYGPRLSTRLGLPMTTWATSLGVEDGGVVVTRNVLGGRAETAIRCEPETALIVSCEPGLFDPSPIGNIEAVTLQDVFAELAPTSADSGVAKSGPKITDADRVVSGGRGMKGPDGVALIEELARVMDAAIGSSGAAVLQGMLPHDLQVGSSGVVIRPKLYLAVGISGTPQHTWGMKDSQYIVAINKDPNAPIFQMADFGIVGDLFEVVPALIAELKAS
jgi:electron transfer flavoprotein alpha subunit